MQTKKKLKFDLSCIQIFNILIFTCAIVMMQKFALIWLITFSLTSFLIILYYPYRLFNLVLACSGAVLVIGMWQLTTNVWILKYLAGWLNQSLDKYSLRNIMLNQVESLYNDQYSTFLKILLFNEKIYDNEQYLLFKDLGILHLLVVSGLHVNVFCLFFNRIFKKHFYLACYFNLIICMFLFYLTNFSISILRIIFGLILIQFKAFRSLNAFERNCWVGMMLCVFVRDAASYSFILTMICTLAINFIVLVTQHFLTRLFYINFILFFISLPITINFNGYFNITSLLNGLLYSYVFLFLFYYSLFFVWIAELVTINSALFNFIFTYFEQLFWLQYLYQAKIEDWTIAAIYFCEFLGINLYFYKLNSNKRFWINYNKQYA